LTHAADPDVAVQALGVTALLGGVLGAHLTASIGERRRRKGRWEGVRDGAPSAKRLGRRIGRAVRGGARVVPLQSPSALDVVANGTCVRWAVVCYLESLAASLSAAQQGSTRPTPHTHGAIHTHATKNTNQTTKRQTGPPSHSPIPPPTNTPNAAQTQQKPPTTTKTKK
jgi:hypothetical protein